MPAMQLVSLSLTEFRNFQQLQVSLPAGLVVVHGDNGQGKSNLMEAAYLLAVARSFRAQADRDLITLEAAQTGGFTMVQGTAERDNGGPVELRVGLERVQDALTGEVSLRKHFRVNGINKRASELVGQLNAVLFSPDDIELVYGSPQGRRRYLDMLISQVEPQYLRALQRYQRVLTQRNSLLHRLRDGHAGETELEFWDDSLCTEGATVLASRHHALQQIAPMAEETHRRLSDSEASFLVTYDATTTFEGEASVEVLRKAMADALVRTRPRERAQGMTVVGPHRDDLRLSVGTMEMGRYASRGQARLGTLALRLAEGRFLHQRRGEAPVLLLDDVLSELDKSRRQLVLEEAMGYPQAILTTADLSLLGPVSDKAALRLRIVQGQVSEEA
jgi:DNA replication and repair protein RecF